MKIVDANVLLYAVNSDSEHHEASRAWLDASLSGADRVGLCWVTLLAFLRVSTRPGLFDRPLAPEEAMRQVEQWVGASSAVVVHPTPRHPDILSRLLSDTGSGGNIVMDAHLAALAIEHRARLVTYDRDFDRFDGVAWQRPDELLG